MDTETLAKLIKEENEQTRRHFDDKAAEMGRHFDEKAAETQHHFDEKAAESRRHFDVVAESLESQIRVIAEGHGVLVEKIDRLETKLDGFIVETRTNFEEVRASIKFSYAELDWRVAHLESFVQDLSTRMQRIEARQTA